MQRIPRKRHPPDRAHGPCSHPGPGRRTSQVEQQRLALCETHVQVEEH